MTGHCHSCLCWRFLTLCVCCHVVQGGVFAREPNKCKGVLEQEHLRRWNKNTSCIPQVRPCLVSCGVCCAHWAIDMFAATLALFGTALGSCDECIRSVGCANVPRLLQLHALFLSLAN